MLFSFVDQITAHSRRQNRCENVQIIKWPTCQTVNPRYLPTNVNASKLDEYIGNTTDNATHCYNKDRVNRSTIG